MEKNLEVGDIVEYNKRTTHNPPLMIKLKVITVRGRYFAGEILDTNNHSYIIGKTLENWSMDDFTLCVDVFEELFKALDTLEYGKA